MAHKTIFRTVVFALFFAAVVSANAQQAEFLREIQQIDTDGGSRCPLVTPRFEFGISAAIGSNFHHYTAGAVNGKPTTSFGFGLMPQVIFRRMGDAGSFAVRPEVHYERVRAQHPNGEIATNNITVPLSLVGQVRIACFGIDGFLGGYYSHRFSGTQGGYALDFTNLFYRNEIGLTWGFGVFLYPFRLGYTNRRALTNFTQQPNDDRAHIRNRANYFTLTFMF